MLNYLFLVKHPFQIYSINLLFAMLRRVVNFQSISLTKRILDISYCTDLRILIDQVGVNYRIDDLIDDLGRFAGRNCHIRADPQQAEL